MNVATKADRVRRSGTILLLGFSGGIASAAMLSAAPLFRLTI